MGPYWLMEGLVLLQKEVESVWMSTSRTADDMYSVAVQICLCNVRCYVCASFERGIVIWDNFYRLIC